MFSPKDDVGVAEEKKNVAVLVHFGGKWARVGVPKVAAVVQGAKSYRNRSNQRAAEMSAGISYERIPANCAKKKKSLLSKRDPVP